MEIKKKLISEATGVNETSKKTFSSKKQNIVITESQLQNLLYKLSKK